MITLRKTFAWCLHPELFIFFKKHFIVSITLILLEIGSEAKGKKVLPGKPQRNFGKPATALRGRECSGPYPMTELAGDLSSYGCDQPVPKSSGRSEFLLDIFTHSCSQHLVT